MLTAKSFVDLAIVAFGDHVDVWGVAVMTQAFSAV